ncbi:MAG: hypothetical protein ABI840_03795, partial [bacterium]
VAHGLIDADIIINGSEWIFGNPYIGAEFDIPKTPVYFQLGLRIPLVPDSNGVAKFAGTLSDFDRSEAFIEHVFPIYGAVNFETVSENKILFAARGGLNLWFYNDTLDILSNPSAHVDYQLQTGYIDKNLNIIFSAVGRYDVSTNAKVKEKNNILMYGLSVVVPYKKIRPALSFRVPGSDLSKDVLNYVVGLNFGYVF